MSIMEFPKDLKFANLKDIVGMISHIISKGYIDSLGVVRGERKNPAYLPIFTIKDQSFVKYFKNTLLDFDLLYEFIKIAKNKSSITCECNSIGEIVDMCAVVKDEDNNLVERHFPLRRTDMPNVIVVFDGYDNTNIFNSTTYSDIDVYTFVDAITNDYIYTNDTYVITREAVPKPKKLISCNYGISANVKNGDDSYIYFTTNLIYDLIDIKIASVCYDIGESMLTVV